MHRPETFRLETLKGGDHFEEVDVDWRTTVTLILNICESVHFPRRLNLSRVISNSPGSFHSYASFNWRS